MEIIKELMIHQTVNMDMYPTLLKNNLINVLTNQFPTGTGKKTYDNCIFLNENTIDVQFKELLKNQDFYNLLIETIEFGLYRNLKDYSDLYQNTPFKLYSKYTYEDVCRLLQWEKGEVPLNIGGYKYDKVTKTYPVFINYDKQENISETTKYEDELLSQHDLLAISKSNRSMQSEDVYTALNAQELGVVMHLFIRKNKDDKISKEFYYLGTMKATGKAEEFIMPNTKSSAVEIYYQLDTPVRKDIYDYIKG